jgi:hypothetical protein
MNGDSITLDAGHLLGRKGLRSNLGSGVLALRDRLDLEPDGVQRW